VKTFWEKRARALHLLEGAPEKRFIFDVDVAVEERTM